MSQDEVQIKSSFNFSNENNLCLFSYSNLKSKGKVILSEYNTFNFDFSKNDQNTLKVKNPNDVYEEDNLRYIKNVNIDIQSLKGKTKNEIMNHYEDSFVKFCGINKKHFIEIYLNNIKFNPEINEFGDISICIKGIVDIIKTYSESKRLKIKRNRQKKIKSKNLFKILHHGNKKEKSHKFEKNKNFIKNNFKKENNENDDPSLNIKDKMNEIKPKSKTLFTIKKKLKNILIPRSDSRQINEKSSNLSNSSLEQKKDLNSSFNNINSNNFLLNDINIDNKKTISCKINKHLPIFSSQNNLSNQTLKSNIQTSNNNNNIVFNFSVNAIQNYDNNSQNKNNENNNKQININSNNNLNTSLNNNLNLNTPINRPILSPINMSPGLESNNILTPNSYHFSNILSPFIINNSPFNNNNVFNDCFNFNNGTTSSFFFNNNENNIENNNEYKNDNNNNDNNNVENI